MLETKTRQAPHRRMSLVEEKPLVTCGVNSSDLARKQRPLSLRGTGYILWIYEFDLHSTPQEGSKIESNLVMLETASPNRKKKLPWGETWPTNAYTNSGSGDLDLSKLKLTRVWLVGVEHGVHDSRPSCCGEHAVTDTNHASRGNEILYASHLRLPPTLDGCHVQHFPFSP